MSRHALSFKLECPNCKSQPVNIFEDFAAGDMICADCGMVVGDRIIDTRSEWRTFSNDGAGEDPSRVGGPSDPLLNHDQLDTMISTKDGNTGLSKELGRLQGRTGKSSDRSLIANFRNITLFCDRIGLPKAITDRAKQIFKMAEDDKTLRGKGADAVIGACIYLACKEAKVPRTFKEISALTLVPKKDIGKFSKQLAHYVDRMEAPTTEDFVTRFCSYLELGVEIQKATLEVLQKSKDAGCSNGKSPISVVSAAIYLTSHLFDGFGKTPKDISFVSGVADATIKSSYRDFYAKRFVIVPEKLKHRIPYLPPLM